jgi:integrase
MKRYYADFRDLSDVGGKREALVPVNEKQATADPDIAQRLVADRIKELEALRRKRSLLGITKETALGPFAAHHLVEKKRSGCVTDGWLVDIEHRLENAVEFFGADRELTSIGVPEVQEFIAHLQATDNCRGGKLSGGTIRHYLNCLSNLYRRAQAECYVPPGYNPIAALMEKPTAKRQEASWLEVHDAALLLEAARTRKLKRADLATSYSYELIATFLLTGGRRSEVLGLEVGDVSFDRKTVTFRPNHWRRLKTATSHRVIPLWPQLEAILRPYVFGAEAPPGNLLFPSLATGKEAMLIEPRKIIDTTAIRAGWEAGEIRTKMLRHTYCSARLQTLDNRAPVSPFTVSRELGHGGEAMVRRVYGHLGEVRHRSKHVEYRVEQHKKKLGERLEALRKLETADRLSP